MPQAFWAISLFAANQPMRRPGTPKGFETVRHYVVMGGGDGGSLPDAVAYEDLIASQEAGFPYPDLDDRLNDYLISHSGNAAFNTASGVAPYARVVALKPAPQVPPSTK